MGLTHTSKITFLDNANNELGESKEYNQYFQVRVSFKI